MTTGTAEFATRCKNNYGLEVNTHTRPSLNRGDFLPRSSCPLAPPAAFLRSSLGQRLLAPNRQTADGSRFAARRCLSLSIYFIFRDSGRMLVLPDDQVSYSPDPSTLATSLYHIGKTQRAHLHPRPFFHLAEKPNPFVACAERHAVSIFGKLGNQFGRPGLRVGVVVLAVAVERKTLRALNMKNRPGGASAPDPLERLHPRSVQHQHQQRQQQHQQRKQQHPAPGQAAWMQHQHHHQQEQPHPQPHPQPQQQTYLLQPVRETYKSCDFCAKRKRKCDGKRPVCRCGSTGAISRQPPHTLLAG